MKLWIVVLLAVPAVANAACKPGYKTTDVPGVCVEIDKSEMNNRWVSDEKPPEDKMPSWQREGVTIATATNMAITDETADKEKADAIKEGKRKAGLK